VVSSPQGGLHRVQRAAETSPCGIQFHGANEAIVAYVATPTNPSNLAEGMMRDEQYESSMVTTDGDWNVTERLGSTCRFRSLGEHRGEGFVALEAFGLND
jgi:hypothetical protein